MVIPIQLALIGSPVQSSKSDLYHNRFIEKMGLNAQYQKFEVTKSQLHDFLDKASQRFLGLSVTMPLKEVILDYLDDIDPAASHIGAVNTIVFKNNKRTGFNTDSIATSKAVKSLYPKMELNKKILIVGAGGVAKAIIADLQKQGAEVILCNRNIERAKTIANQFKIPFYPYEHLASLLQQDVAMLINATSIGMMNTEYLIEPNCIPKHIAILDVVSAPKNNWLTDLAQTGHETVSGRQFWIQQAIEQYRIWYDDQLDLSEAINKFCACFSCDFD